VRVLVDSCVWSAVLRRGTEATDPVRREMQALIDRGAVELVGPIRQEVLSGVRRQSQFQELREALGLFPEIGIEPRDYEEAARLYNLCRSKGIQGSGTDLLICAVAMREEVPIFTVDLDFLHYASVFPVPLHPHRLK
jgi:predicted nucleic acid-binding protein